MKRWRYANIIQFCIAAMKKSVLARGSKSGNKMAVTASLLVDEARELVQRNRYAPPSCEFRVMMTIFEHNELDRKHAYDRTSKKWDWRFATKYIRSEYL